MKQKLKNLMTRFNNKNKKIAISVLSVMLVAVMLAGTYAWYKSQVSLEGSTFTTGTLDFIATGYDQTGAHVTTILQENKDPSGYTNVNKPLFTKTNWHAGVTDSAYIVIERTGSLEMEYKISFSAAGDVEYLGGFWYSLTDITNDITGDASSTDEEKLSAYINAGHAPQIETNGYSMATMDKYATRGTILNSDGNKRYYRLDYGMKQSVVPAEYTGKTIEMIPTIFVTQVGALDSDESLGYTYNCSTAEDIEKARDYSLPGDSIKLMNNIIFEGDLVFNKAVNILTNNFTLTVRGNLIYDYTSPKPLTINVAGNGSVIVSSPGDGIGGNFTVTTPGSDVNFIGSNNSAGDIVVASKFTVNATRSYGASGATFNRVKIIDEATYTPVTIYVNSDTRVTVTDNTTITRLEAVARSSNIEVQNAGTIQTVALSGMNVLPQTTSPQIYIVNMGYIVQPIELPSWSTKFNVITEEPLTCEGNTRIVQTITGNDMTVTGSDSFTNDDIERESTEILVAPIGNNDAELVIYYQNTQENGTPIETSVEYLLEKYFTDKGIADPDISIAAIRRLDIISIGDKALVNEDFSYLKSEALNSLSYLDLSRANAYDTVTGAANKLCDTAFKDFKRIKTLILPQNLEEIGTEALAGIDNQNIITVPGSVTVFGADWFVGNNYVAFGASVPVLSAQEGMLGVKAVFVEEYYVDSYKAAYTDYADIIFPMAQKDDSETHFVRQLSGSGEWEIVYCIGNGSTEVSVGENLSIGNTPITVTRVGENAYRTALKDVQATVRFADTIHTIGEKAFYNTNIVKVENWSVALNTIRSYAFGGCEELAGDIVLPDSLRTIKEGAFDGCAKITSVNTGGADLIEGNVFANCSSLVWAELPRVETISQAACTNASGVFYNDAKLVSVKLPLLEKSSGILFNKTQTLTEVVFGSDMYDDVAVSDSQYTSFYTTFGSPKVYFNMVDVSGISIKNVDSVKIYPAGEKMGEKYIGGYNVGEFIVSDILSGDETVTLITTNNNNLNGIVTIPSEWNGKPITTIFNGAFRNSNFTNVTLNFPDSLRSIGEYAFYKKTGIVAVGSWGVSLESIGKYAFYGSGIKGALIFPTGTQISIGDYAFSGCKNITYLNTGGAETLGIQAFSGCSTLVSAELPEVVTVGNGTNSNNMLFANCSFLVSARMPKLLSVQSRGIFSGCTSLREFYMASIEKPSLGTYPFDNLSNDQKKKIRLYVPEELVASYRGWSGSLGGIASQTYPEGTKIGENLVNGYNIGNYVISINDDGVTATLVTSNLSYADTVVLDNALGGYTITAIGDYAFANQTFTNASVTVGDSVKTINQYAFNKVTGIVSIDLNNTEDVQGYAFQGCSALAELKADELLTISGSYAFSECTSIKTLILPKLQNAGAYAFHKCTALEKATLPEVTNLGNYVFDYDSHLKSVYFEKIVKFGTSTTTNIFRYCSNLEELIINKPITQASDVPTGNPNLTGATKCTVYVPTIYISYYVKTGTTWNGRPVEGYDDSFTDTAGNTYIVAISGTDCVIEHFLGAASITSLTVPNTMTIDGVTYTVVGIEYGAFESVSDYLTAITLPSGMNQFKSNCLSELGLLTSISVADGSQYYTADENGVLFSADGRILVKYPAGKPETSYVVGDTVILIGDHAFQNCTNLTEITIGAAVLVIDSTSFGGCALQTVTFMSETPPVLMGSDVFETTGDGFAVVIPAGKTDVYTAAINYNRYIPFMREQSEG